MAQAAGESVSEHTSASPATSPSAGARSVSPATTSVAADSPVEHPETSTESPADEHGEGQQLRPYPGAGAEMRQKKLPPVSVTSARRDDAVDPGIERTSIEADVTAGRTDLDNERRPMMAPALRRGRRAKKRGFFKRLFGLR